MNRVLDVARYIINYSNEKDYGVSNLKLQKLLYLVQAYFLLNSNDVCFEEEIQAWDFGPVVPEAYHEFKRFGSGDIPPVITYYEMKDGFSSLYQYEFNEGVIPESDRNLIAQVIDNFKDYSATDLVRLTHHQDPWRNAYCPGENRKIDIADLQRYFADE